MWLQRLLDYCNPGWPKRLYLWEIRGSADKPSVYYLCQSLPLSLVNPAFAASLFQTRRAAATFQARRTHARTGSHLKDPPATFKRISHHILWRLNLSFSWPNKCASISRACKFIHGRWRPGFQTDPPKSSTPLITTSFSPFPLLHSISTTGDYSSPLLCMKL